jgi:hypothetical protein
MPRPVRLNGQSRDFEQSFDEFVNGGRRVAIDGLRRVLPLRAVNPFRVIDGGRDPRGKLLEIISTLLVFPNMSVEERPDCRASVEALPIWLEMKEQPNGTVIRRKFLWQIGLDKNRPPGNKHGCWT